MKDAYGREIEYLRISVTDKCNLRCRYCMPPEGVPCVPHKDVLTLEEIAELVRIMAGMGIKKVRLTGGEPLVRKNITELVRRLHATPGIGQVALTTNGVLLAQMLPELKAAGLDSVNISIDTLHADSFRKITGTEHLREVLQGIEAAYADGLRVKLNCVPCRELNGGELVELVQFAKDRQIDVRFIELMPIGLGKQFHGIPTAEILQMLDGAYGAAEKLKSDTEGPAEYYRIDGFAGRIGFISPISHRFCEQCNRLRLTAEGRLKLCLYYKDGIDLRALLRGGVSEEEIRENISAAVWQKPKQHCFGAAGDDAAENRRMNQIGG
ncbi:MAG: GTP 3',8-cyclase MoaA [Lachnospiraceae bacterium]|nr:GTP 3',8-cyclase MoaA [Lachnospiraceae bacterium]